MPRAVSEGDRLIVNVLLSYYKAGRSAELNVLADAAHLARSTVSGYLIAGIRYKDKYNCASFEKDSHKTYISIETPTVEKCRNCGIREIPCPINIYVFSRKTTA